MEYDGVGVPNTLSKYHLFLMHSDVTLILSNGQGYRHVMCVTTLFVNFAFLHKNAFFF
jgi:hypothetical protein